MGFKRSWVRIPPARPNNKTAGILLIISGGCRLFRRRVWRREGFSDRPHAGKESDPRRRDSRAFGNSPHDGVRYFWVTIPIDAPVGISANGFLSVLIWGSWVPNFGLSERLQKGKDAPETQTSPRRRSVIPVSGSFSSGHLFIGGHRVNRRIFSLRRTGNLLRRATWTMRANGNLLPFG